MFHTKVVEIINAHLCSGTSFFENRAAYEMTCKNIVQTDRTQMTERRMRIACWVPKSTSTLSDY